MGERGDPRGAVEAALFAAGRPLTAAELAEALGLSVEEVRAAVARLGQEYESKASAIEVVERDGTYVMQLRGRYAGDALTFAPRELSNPVLRTLALIAYYQPLLQSDLASMRGNKAYDHIAELVGMELVAKRPHRLTFLLTTTPKFAEYFDLPGATTAQVKERIAREARGGTLEGWMGETLAEMDIIHAVRKLLPKMVL